MSVSDSQPVFTICIPSYNRGLRALNLVKALLPDIDDDWELLILDNFSWQEVESYQELACLAETEPCLSYIRQLHNPGFYTNYLACFESAKAPYIMVVYDEDFPNPAMIRSVLPLLHQYPSVGILRGSLEPLEGVSAKNAEQFIDMSYFRGEEALLGFAFINNYASGTIYNRSLFQELGLIERFKNRLIDNAIYPHLYLELLACAVTDVVTTAEICCFEGEDQAADTNNPDDYKPPYSFGSRIEQFLTFREGLWEAIELIGMPFDKVLFATIYLVLCKKYMYLVTRVNSAMYKKHHIHPGLLHNALMHVCCAAVSSHPELEGFEAYLFNQIKEIHEKFEPYI